MFYGIHPNVKPDYENIKAPILGFFGEKDSSVSPAKVKALSEKLNSAGKQHQFHTYPGLDHAFFNDTRAEVYDANAAADSWNKTLEFFRTNVK